MPTSHRRVHTAALALLACVCVLLGAPAAGHAAAAPRLIVGFVPSTGSDRQIDALRSAGVRGITTRSFAKSRIKGLDAVVVNVAPGAMASTRAKLAARSDVRYVEIDHVAHAYVMTGDIAADGVPARGADLSAAWHPNDTFLIQQWALGKIGAEAAWEQTRGTGVTIAVVDTGVDYIHPDLVGRVDKGRDFVDGDEDPMDVQGHGTHVAGIAAGGADDGFGVAGLAPGARILAVRVLDGEGAGNYSQVANGVVHAADRGAKVINLSLGGPEGSALLESAVSYAAARGAIVTCASGNESATAVGYPGRYDGCLSVGATDEGDGHGSFSNTGAGLDISAPGVQILSSTMVGGHEAWDGTSMATPYVSGLAALLMSQGLGRRDALAAMTSTARDLGAPGTDTSFGVGRIDAAAAVAAGARTPRSTTPDTVKPTVTALEALPRKVTTTTTFKDAWKVTKKTAFKRIGTTEFRGRYTWSKTAVRGRVRTVTTWQMRGGIVYRRTITHTKLRTPVKRSSSVIPVRVTADDDLGVDRVALEIDGRIVGVDWSAADGWIIEIPCAKTGVKTVVGWAYDVADNESGGKADLNLTC